MLWPSRSGPHPLGHHIDLTASWQEHGCTGDDCNKQMALARPTVSERVCLATVGYHRQEQYWDDDSIAQDRQLAIGIADANLIQVNQGKPPKTAKSNTLIVAGDVSSWTCLCGILFEKKNVKFRQLLDLLTNHPTQNL